MNWRTAHRNKKRSNKVAWQLFNSPAFKAALSWAMMRVASNAISERFGLNFCVVPPAAREER